MSFGLLLCQEPNSNKLVSFFLFATITSNEVPNLFIEVKDPLLTACAVPSLIPSEITLQLSFSIWHLSLSIKGQEIDKSKAS